MKKHPYEPYSPDIGVCKVCSRVEHHSEFDGNIHTQPNTIATRFAEKRILNRIVAWAVNLPTRSSEFGSFILGDDDKIAAEFAEKQKDLLAFFQAELLALADEVKTYKQPVRKGSVDPEEYENIIGTNAGLETAITLIRNRAN